MTQNLAETYTPGTIFTEPQWNAVTKALSGLNQSQLTWVSGYAAGLAASQIASASQPNNVESVSQITVLFGSQTGNAKQLAENFYRDAASKGLNAKLSSMADYKPRQLKNETFVVIFVSTHGEGDAPDDAVELHEFLGGKKAPKLDGLKYAVLSLGDSSYEFFCQTGKDFDERLRKAGATSLIERADCDVDYESEAASWSKKLIEVLTQQNQVSSVSVPAGVASAEANTAVNTYNKKSPFTATLIESQKITGRDSVKDIRHIEISLEGSGIRYQPGDALGVWFKNSPVLVNAFLQHLQLDGNAPVTVGDSSTTLEAALSSKVELTLSYPSFVKAYQQAVQSDSLAELLSDNARLRTYLAERQLIDIVREHPGNISPQQLVDACRPITPRLYSIASSQSEVEDEVHLTVAHVDYLAFGERHQGGASGYLCEYLEENGEVDVYIEPNANFRLPETPDTPVIMVGPGTGIAPFRAFIQERDVTDSKGKNWLFFGNPNFTQDFLYQVEWQDYVKRGVLDKITLAFSRDQAEKIYVQHRLLEHAQEVFEWLEQGAHFYVCGDAMKMAKDVENALLSIIQTHGGKSESEAKAYLLALRKAKRYQKDVY